MNVPLSPGSPLLAGTAGLSLGISTDELRTALRSGARRIVAGTRQAELAVLLPPEDPNADILALAAECRLLHNAETVRLLAQTIHYRTHLLPTEQPRLEIILSELLSNAIEHGNLGLTAARKAQIGNANWFDGYLATVNNHLRTARGSTPVLVTCIRSGNEVRLSVTDGGNGFNVTQVLSRVDDLTSPTGRGLKLLQAWLGPRLSFRDNGRTACARLSVQPQPGHSFPTRATVRENSSILVVDPHVRVTTSLQGALHYAGFRNVHALTDHTALPAYAARLQPDMILLALHTPAPDGFALLHQLKSNPQTATIPAVFICPYDHQADKNQAFHQGATDVITSPVDPVELAARVTGHLYQNLMLAELKTLTTRLESELDRAKTFQHDLFPTASLLTSMGSTYNITLASHYQGCEALAGDYWTVLPLDDTRFAFAVADFTGHGTVAALNTVQLHTLLRHETSPANPALTTASLSAQLSRLLGKGSFATFIYGVVDVAAHTLTYTGCGAPNLMLRHADGQLEALDCSGLPLGLAPDIPVLPRRATLPPDSVLVAYSDALTDTLHHPLEPTRQPQPWGQQGLQNVLAQLTPPANQTFTAPTLLDALLDTFHTTAKLPLQDDLTLLTISLNN